jgi:hypothetical protein
VRGIAQPQAVTGGGRKLPSPGSCAARFPPLLVAETRGGNAKHGKHKLGKIRGRIDNRLGKRAQAGAGALDVAGDHQKIGRVAREAVNGRGDHDIAGGEGIDHLRQLRPVGRRAGDLLMERLFTPGGAELGELVGEVLGGGRDPGVTVDHARDSASEIRFKKA